MQQEVVDNSTVQNFEMVEEKVEKKPYEVEVPKDIDDYYIMDSYSSIFSLEGFSENFVYHYYQRGLAFKTREETEQYDKERILLFKLHKWAEKHNGGWKPNWDDEDERKYFIEYDHHFEILGFSYFHTLNLFSRLPYLKSEEIAKQFIEEFGEEIKEVLC